MLTILEHTRPTLREAQAIVDGYVELVQLASGDQLLVNEEGLLRGLPLNEKASALAGRYIVGNAIILKGKARWS